MACAVQAALGADKVTFEQGVYLDNYGADWQMENAAKACDGADAAILFLGLSSIKDHRIPKPDFLQVDEGWARSPHPAVVHCLAGLFGGAHPLSPWIWTACVPCSVHLSDCCHLEHAFLTRGSHRAAVCMRTGQL